MNIAGIVSELKTEITRIERAITALEGLSPNGAASPMQAKAASTQRHGGLTAAGRKRLSEMMKKRWTERRKKAGAKG